ncbi:MAG TPA: DsrE family protein [Chitinophagaceae bacterium]
MKHFLILLLTSLSITGIGLAQEKQHKIVFEMVSGDTAVHSAIVRQLNNVLKAAPDAKLEVVFHGNSIYALVKDRSFIKESITDLVKNKKVVIAACANSLKRLNLTADQLVPEAIVVPVAILEIVKRQEEGWSYIKSGH